MMKKNPTILSSTTSVLPLDDTTTHLINRDQSILQFNHRVLDWARRDKVPLLERLRYVCIVSSNLDEFFEVRAEPHVRAMQSKQQKGAYTQASFIELAAQAHALVQEQYRVYNEVILPLLATQDIHILSHGERTIAQRRWVKQFFEREVRPLVTPISLDPAHPFPQVANKSLNFIVKLENADAFGRYNSVAILRIPRSLPRLIRLPKALTPAGQACFVSISSVVRAHLRDLFEGREIGEFSQFRVTRHSDLAVDEDDVKNLRTALREGLEVRHFGQAVRLEVSASCSPFLTEFLLSHFKLPDGALYRVNGPVNLVRLTQLIDLVDNPKLVFPPHMPAWPTDMAADTSIFDQMRQQDILIHQPFQSFEGVIALLREAVNDPNVLAIRQTIYRTGSDSEMMVLLRRAVQLGKEVMVVVELKARFDEEANINWAEMFESIGAQVVYGVLGLKTHAKMLLITRREGRKLVRYGHLSTGNYNPKTAKLYTDFSMLTANPALTLDMQNLFIHLASQNKLPKLTKLVAAPFHLHKFLLAKINTCTLVAKSDHKPALKPTQKTVRKNRQSAGQTPRIILKMNALTDLDLIAALLKASQAGVQIDLIVRGACMLRPGIPGVSENIRVRSIIGRFLEHTRVFYFQRSEAAADIYLGSADGMSRNMLRRVEVAWPVLDETLKKRIVDEGLMPYLSDTEDAWVLQPDGQYVPLTNAEGISAQHELKKLFTL